MSKFNGVIQRRTFESVFHLRGRAMLEKKFDSFYVTFYARYMKGWSTIVVCGVANKDIYGNSCGTVSFSCQESCGRLASVAACRRGFKLLWLRQKDAPSRGKLNKWLSLFVEIQFVQIVRFRHVLRSLTYMESHVHLPCRRLCFMYRGSSCFFFSFLLSGSWFPKAPLDNVVVNRLRSHVNISFLFEMGGFFNTFFF